MMSFKGRIYLVFLYFLLLLQQKEIISMFLITFAWSAALHADIDVDVMTAVWILSTGLSLPNETGLGLSEHGDASRETLSESSSLNTVPEIVGKRREKKYEID